MRPNNQAKRLRGRNRSKNTNPLARSYESNGPDVKIRGSALQVADKYAQLARDAQSSGDRVMAENYLQHAEHYYRIVAAAYEQNNQRPPHHQPRQDDREGGRFGDPFRGEQPNVNGFDGVEEDDEGLRRAMRSGGGFSRDDDEEDDDEAPASDRPQFGGDRPQQHHRGNGNGHEGRYGDRPYNGNGNGNGHGHGGGANGVPVPQAQPQPVIPTEPLNGTAVEPLEGQGDEDGGEAKPKRRRSSRSRSRARRADGAAGGDAPATPPSDAGEPTT